MHKIQEVLRLRHDAGMSHAQIARACGLSKGVVNKYLKLANDKNIGWPGFPVRRTAGRSRGHGRGFRNLRSCHGSDSIQHPRVCRGRG